MLTYLILPLLLQFLIRYCHLLLGLLSLGCPLNQEPDSDMYQGDALAPQLFCRGLSIYIYIYIVIIDQSDHWIIGHLPYKGPSPPISHLRWPARSRKSPGGSKVLPLTDDRGQCAHWTLQDSRNVSVLFPQLCASRQSCLVWDPM